MPTQNELEPRKEPLSLVYCSNWGASVSDRDETCTKCGTLVSTRPNPGPNIDPDAVIAEDRHEEAKHVNSTIPLVDDETILWHRESTQGLIHKEVFLEEAVTNKRCLKFDVKNKQVVAQIGITRRPEVVVMNLHRVNDSIGGGIFLTPRMFGIPLPGGVYGGPRRGSSKYRATLTF
jgi:hypothetical protein